MKKEYRTPGRPPDGAASPTMLTNTHALSEPTDDTAKPRWVDLFRTTADEVDSRTMPVEWSWEENAAGAITPDNAKLSSTDDMKKKYRTPGRPPDNVASGPVDMQGHTARSDESGPTVFSLATPPPTPRASGGRPHGRPPDLRGSSSVGVEDATMDAIVEKFHIAGIGRPPGPQASQGNTDDVDDMKGELARLLGKITLMCANANVAENRS